MNPLISIIVPVYKVEKVLHYCIESILQQTYKNFELLLIDDGSPDKSGEICDSYAEKDGRIRVIHKKNEGVSVARNTGFDNAKGEYIVCVDSDDYVNECYLQDFVDVVNEYPDAQMVWCGFSTVEDYEKNITENEPYDSSEEKLVITDISNIMILHSKCLDSSPWNKLYKREIIISNNLRMNKDISLGEDLMFNFSYMDSCCNKTIYCLNRKNYNYITVNNESLNSKFYISMFELYKYLNLQMYTFLVKWNIDAEQMKLYYNFVYYSYLRCLDNTFHSQSTYASNKERYRCNKRILQSKEFKEAVEKSNCHILPILKLVYKTNSYWLVKKCNALIKFISDIKNRR